MQIKLRSTNIHYSWSSFYNKTSTLMIIKYLIFLKYALLIYVSIKKDLRLHTLIESLILPSPTPQQNKYCYIFRSIAQCISFVADTKNVFTLYNLVNLVVQITILHSLHKSTTNCIKYSLGSVHFIQVSNLICNLVFALTGTY